MKKQTRTYAAPKSTTLEPFLKTDESARKATQAEKARRLHLAHGFHVETSPDGKEVVVA